MIYMAAGNSRRFGNDNKLLTDLSGKPLYQYGLDILDKIKSDRNDCDLVIITRFAEVISYAESNNIKAIDNPDSEQGLSFTIKAGVRFWQEKATKNDYYLFMTADQPFITEETVTKLLDSVKDKPECASVYFGDAPGSPALISASFTDELMALEGDEGGRKVIRHHNELRVQAANERELFDIDKKSDL